MKNFIITVLFVAQTIINFGIISLGRGEGDARLITLMTILPTLTFLVAYPKLSVREHLLSSFVIPITLATVNIFADIEPNRFFWICLNVIYLGLGAVLYFVVKEPKVMRYFLWSASILPPNEQFPHVSNYLNEGYNFPSEEELIAHVMAQPENASCRPNTSDIVILAVSEIPEHLAEAYGLPKQ